MDIFNVYNICVAIRCSYLDDPRYGKVSVSGVTPGSTANYTCDHGYKLVGNAPRECLYNGSWSGKEPTCESESSTHDIQIIVISYGLHKFILMQSSDVHTLIIQDMAVLT